MLTSWSTSVETELYGAPCTRLTWNVGYCPLVVFIYRDVARVRVLRSNFDLHDADLVEIDALAERFDSAELRAAADRIRAQSLAGLPLPEPRETGASYERRENPAFGKRLFAAMAAGCSPWFVGAIIAICFSWPLWAWLVLLATTIPPALIVVGRRFYWANCPHCDQRISIPWKAYQTGGPLKYQCERCRIEWATRVTPGGYS